ncbi:MAG: NAD(P)-binding domain-containing protein [Pseudomonadota bacterium]|nr:NAD(P)-binding domain-containing protein [Pseudomonadota bacterium]
MQTLSSYLPWLIYGIPAAVAFVLYMRSYKARTEVHQELLLESVAAGLTEPPSLHPVVDLGRCIGSGACVKACPEEALGVVDGKAVLVGAAHCIGHGACFPACPVEAIKLVFGTEKRGIDIPVVKPNFESNVPGIFIAGELGGMGLIRKAAEQGKQAMYSMITRKGKPRPGQKDVVIIGAGPAGLGAGLAAIEKKVDYVIIEQEDNLGGSVYHYPRNKIAMTAPVNLPVIGKMQFKEVRKETLLEFWQGVVQKTQLNVKFRTRMEKIEHDPAGGFIVHTAQEALHTRLVLLAIGRRGTPRKLDVPGEEQSKVVYRLIDPAQYRGQHVTVVGGGDSALEAAIALSEEDGTSVTLSYRSEAFSRVKEKNRQRLKEQQDAGRIRVELKSKVRAIHKDHLDFETTSGREQLPNDIIIICAGGILPTALLKDIGISFSTKHGEVEEEES